MSLKKQNYSWWRFFDKAGDSCNFTYDEDLDKWSGTIYLDEVSADLIEYEPLYILQEVATPAPVNSGNLYRPKKLNLTPWCPGATYNNILARWKDTEPGSTYANVPEFFLWSIENYPGPTPTVLKHDDLNIELDDNSLDLVGRQIPPVGGIVGGTGQAVATIPGSTWNAEALSIRVGLQSKEEGSFTRTLQLIDPNYLYEIGPSPNNFGCTAGTGVTGIGATHVFAEITFYGETVGEDERLETMIENFGNTINNSDFKIFDDVDINETLPDYIKLNSKRKELLLEWDNIFPFTGSYKALINVLKWFGYDQVTLKEYWLNVDELQGKNKEGISRIVYKQTPIEDLFSTEPKTALMGDQNMIPNKVFKKTSKFGLFYDITRDSGKFDNDGIPIVEEAFLFSNEEVLIKLFALKQKLKNYFLPLNARIIDIVGEAIYYARYDVNIWNDQLRVDDIELNINPCVKFIPEDGCSLITDLTPERFIGIKIPPNLDMSGATDFQTYAFGITGSNVMGVVLDMFGPGDYWQWTDNATGATLRYTNPTPGATQAQIRDAIVDFWNAQTQEPWSSFTAMKGVTGSDDYAVIINYPSGNSPWGTGPTFSTPIAPTASGAGGYFFTITQTDLIGPTGGASFSIITGGYTGGPGPTNTGASYSTPITTYSFMFNYFFETWLNPGPLAAYNSAFMGWFGNSNRSVYDLPDNPCAPIAAPFILDNCSFDLIWDDAKVTYNQLDFQLISATNLAFQQYNFSKFDYSYTDGSYPLSNGINPYGAIPTNSGSTWGNAMGSILVPTNMLATYALGVSGNTAGWGYNSGPLPWGPYSPGCTLGCGPTPGSPLNWAGGPTLLPGMSTIALYSLGATIAQVTSPFDNPILYNWNNVGQGNYYELEWIITHDSSDYKIESGLLSLEDGDQYPILLEKTGTYTVELRLYDGTGGFSRWIEKAALCVETKDLDFIGHYRSRVCDYNWDNKTFKRQSDIVPPPTRLLYPDWAHYNSTWDLPLQENEQMSMQDLTYNDLDRIEFYQTQNDPANQGYCDEIETLPQIPGTTASSGLNDLDAYKWNLIEDTATWEEMCHLWWDIMNPKITQMSIGATLSNYQAGSGADGMDANYFVLVDEPLHKTPNQLDIHITGSPTLAMMLLYNPSYGQININFDSGATGETNVYQYYGGPTGVIGGSSWVEIDTLGSIDWVGISDLMVAGAGTDQRPLFKQIVSKFNEHMKDNPGVTAHPQWSKFLCYYNEEYLDPLNPLVPYARFVSKKQSNNQKHKFYWLTNLGDAFPYSQAIYQNQALGATVGPAATPDFVYSYETVNFGDMGDIPTSFEIFSVGASGGMISIPGPSTWLDNFGNTVEGITAWNYGFTATGLSALYTALTNVSQGLNIAGTGASGVTGPILNYGFNMVYGYSGWVAPGWPGPTYQIPPGLEPIKIIASTNYFASYEDQCVSFTASGVTGATNDDGIGGTHGIAGTMCGRSITSNSTWDTLRIHKYTKEFPVLTQIQFNYSLSPMEGKTYPSWTLIKENDNNWENIYYNNPYFSYLFTQKGSYTLELNVTDNNGNSKTKTKKEFIKII